MNEKTLVVYSGGQDSTTCLYWAINQYGRDNVLALGFTYGQKHKSELSAARQICIDNNIEYHILNLDVLGKMTTNALVNSNIEMDDDSYLAEYPNTFVDGRNHLFLSFAAVFAKQNKIHNIITGICQTDFSGYPDCRDIFIRSLNLTLILALDYQIEILTPLMWMDKSEIWELAEKLDCLEVIKNKTITCYQGIIGKGCGKCPACKLRNNGYSKYKNKKNNKNYL